MQTNKRVYPSERKPSKWLSYLLLFLSAVVIFSGLASRRADQPTIEPLATATPVPLEEGFDETRETREITLGRCSWHALQLGAFEQESSANELAAQYQKRGAAGFVWQDSRYRVLAAVYPLREDAQRVREQLNERHSVDSYLYEITLPEIHLRLGGMKGQLDILEAGFLHAEDAVAGLQELSVIMDRQEISNEEAIARLMNQKEQLDLVALRLQQRFTQPRNAAVQQLIDFFRDYSAFVESLNASDSSAALGQRVKYQTLRSIRLLWQLRDSL